MDVHNQFQLLGNNLFKSTSPQQQAQLNEMRFNNLLTMMDVQKQQVADYNMNMKSKEQQLQELERNNQNNQRALILNDQQRNNHNSIRYNQYTPTNHTLKPKTQEQHQHTQYQNLQQMPSQNHINFINKDADPLEQPKYQQYNQGFPTTQNYIQMSQNPQYYKQQQGQQNDALENFSQAHTQKSQLSLIYRQIEEQNEYLRQLAEVINQKRVQTSRRDDSQSEDSLESMMRLKEEQKQTELLLELKELKEKVKQMEKKPYTPQYGVPPPIYNYPQAPNMYPGMMPPMMPPGMMPPGMMPPNMMNNGMPGMMPGMMPPQIPNFPPYQQQPAKRADDQLTQELMAELLRQTKRQNYNQRRGDDSVRSRRQPPSEEASRIDSRQHTQMQQ